MDNRTENSSSDSENEQHDIFVYTVGTKKGDQWIAPLHVNGTLLPLKVDTGAQVNLLSMSDYNALKKRPKLQHKKINLRAYNNQNIPVAGTCRLRIKCNTTTYNVAFIVVPGDDYVSLLGVRASKQMGLVKRSH